MHILKKHINLNKFAISNINISTKKIDKKQQMKHKANRKKKISMRTEINYI